MLLDLRVFRGGTEEIDRHYPPEVFPRADADFRVAAPVDLALKVTKDARKVRLAGRLRTTLEAVCGRCLEPIAVPVDTELDLLFLPESDLTDPAAGEHEVHDADVGVSFYKDETIDLGAVIRDEFYLALPMKPLCRPDCRGLCPVCGANRNRETCACRTEWVDPRMEQLRTLLKKTDK